MKTNNSYENLVVENISERFKLKSKIIKIIIIMNKLN